MLKVLEITLTVLNGHRGPIPSSEGLRGIRGIEDLVETDVDNGIDNRVGLCEHTKAPLPASTIPETPSKIPNNTEIPGNRHHT